MNHYDNEYYFVLLDSKNKRLPELMADDDTADRRFRSKCQPVGSAPLIFSNGFKEDFKRMRVKEQIADVLFDGSNFMVETQIRDKLLHHPIPNMCMHPGIYIDDSGHWHENYWYVTFIKSLDCWDRETSEYDDDPIVIAASVRYNVHSYSFDKKILDEIPLEERLLFKLGGTIDGNVVCHKSLAELFRGENSGVQLMHISES